MVSLKILKFIGSITDEYETFKDAKGVTLLIDPDEDPELAAKIDAELLIVGKTQLEAEQKPQPPYLPQLPDDRKYTLVLDLDETLIHYRDEEEYYLVRPGVDKFLSELSELYDIVLFTAGVK
jgi:TFIIF-interacting CTD phosphatase-like protein